MSFKERFESMEINLNQFYKMGIYCFLVISFANLFTLLHNWNIMIFSAKVSGLFGVIFNFCLVLFFKYLLNGLPKEEVKAPEEVNFDEMIEKLE